MSRHVEMKCCYIVPGDSLELWSGSCAHVRGLKFAGVVGGSLAPGPQNLVPRLISI